MNSHIFNSNACAACRSTSTDPSRLRVLRTPTRDICGECGELLSEFPAITSIQRDAKLITIPPEISGILEKLLRQRLFVLGNGYQPRHADQPVNLDRASKTLVHRAGKQCMITLTGRANTSAVLRWNYSSRSLLPKFPWEELKWDMTSGFRGRPQPELKPNIDALPVPLPAIIARASNAARHLEFTELGFDRNGRECRYLRFEQRFDLEQQPLSTTDDLCLVVKLELEWLHLGKSFPSGAGPRRYAAKTARDFHNGEHTLTLEEAIDRAIYSTVNDYWGGASEIKLENRFPALLTVTNPIAEALSVNPYDDSRPRVLHRSSFGVSGSGRERDHYGPAPRGEERLLSYEQELILNVSIPDPRQTDLSQELPLVKVTIKLDGEIVIDTTYGGPDFHGGYSMCGGWIQHGLSLSDKLPKKNCKITTIITDSMGTRETEYLLVSQKEYLQAWDTWSSEIVENCKRRLLMAARAEESRWHRQTMPEFGAEQQVAAFVQGEWVEGRYVEKTEQGHAVRLVSPGGVELWQALDVKALETALEEGLNVRPPFDGNGSFGFKSRIVQSAETVSPS